MCEDSFRTHEMKASSRHDNRAWNESSRVNQYERAYSLNRKADEQSEEGEDGSCLSIVDVCRIALFRIGA